MSRPIAGIDTDVIILLLDNTTDPVAQQRRAYAELNIENLKKKNARFVVPAPVVAELCGTRPGSEVIRDIVQVLIRDLRIEVLDEDAAVIAGEISRSALKARAGRERGAVKFDTLIAGVAHKLNAKWLLTGNPTDFRKYLAVINSTVEVVAATEPPATGQQVWIQMLKQT